MQNRQQVDNRRGAALFTALVVIMAVSGLVGVMVSGALQRSFTAGKMADGLRAQAIAEAGANKAYSVLVLDFDKRDDPTAFPTESYGGGEYKLGITPVGAGIAVISSTGIYNSVESEVVLDVTRSADGTDPSTPDSVPAFDYAMICGGEFKFRGCGSVSGTNGQALIHANGILDVRGNAQTDVHVSSSTEVQLQNVTVDGDATAPSFDLHKKAVITGTKTTQAVPSVEIPDIDLTPYYNWALAHGEVKNGFHMTGGTYTPDGGILWVNGDVHLTSHYTFNGSIIATGAIDLSGAGDVTATTCAFAVATRDGPDIQNTSSGTITGLIYVRVGDYKHTANGRVVGQIIVQQDIDKGGNSDVLLYSPYRPTPPGSTDGEDGYYYTAVWQK